MKKGAALNLDWLQQLRSDTPAAALLAATEQIRHLDQGVRERMHWLFAVDDALRPCALALVDRFAEARHLPTEEEHRSWEIGRTYHNVFAEALAALLHETTAPPIPAAEAPAIIVRTLRHRGLSALWCHLCYTPLPEGWWLETHQIFAFAEREQISTSEVATAAGLPPTHAAALYLQLLLLDTPNRTYMSRQQIVTLAQWLENQTDAIPIERTFDEESQVFYIKLDEDKGGRRIRNFEPTPGCRYLRTSALISEIEIELEKAESGQMHGVDVELLRQLHVEWSRTGYKRQRRADTRNEVQKRASVAHGIYAVCQEVHNQAMGSTHLSLEGEIWVIENESRNGFGALVSAELNSWLKIGRLLTLREEMNFGMSVVAVIRSLQQQEGGKVYVGAEVLNYMALYTQLQDWPAGSSHPYPGIFLASDEERALPSSLLLPGIEYQPNVELQLKLDRRLRHARLGRLMEQKDDWCRVALELIEDPD